MRDAVDQASVAITRALLDERGKAAHEVDPNFLGGVVERDGDGRQVLCLGRAADLCDGRDGDALVDDRDTVLALELLGRGHELLGRHGQAVVDALRHDVDVLVNAAAQVQPEGDRADVEVILRHHLDGLYNVFWFKRHGCSFVDDYAMRILYDIQKGGGIDCAGHLPAALGRELDARQQSWRACRTHRIYRSLCVDAT